MKLSVKTLTGQVFPIEVDPTSTVRIEPTRVFSLLHCVWSPHISRAWFSWPWVRESLLFTSALFGFIIPARTH